MFLYCDPNDGYTAYNQGSMGCMELVVRVGAAEVVVEDLRVQVRPASVSTSQNRILAP